MGNANMGELHFGAGQDSVAPAPSRPHRWPFIVPIVVLFLAAVGLGYGFAYSTNSAQKWQDSAIKAGKDLAGMTKQRDDLTKQRDDLKAQAGGLETQLGKVTGEYNTATDRIRSLSNEKAQTGDEAAYFATLVAMSQNVTEGMDLCIRDLQKLQTYLVDFDSYEPDSLLNYARQINSGCNQARADSDALSRKLAD